MSDNSAVHPGPIAPEQPRTRRRWPWMIALPVVLAAGFVLGFVAHQPDTVKIPTQATAQKVEAMDRRSANLDYQDEQRIQRASELDQQEAALDQRQQELDNRERSLDEREASIAQQEEIVATNTITDGIWTVGVDLESGTYRASNVSSDCYWAITVTGSNGTDIVQNGIPGGGNPTVTISEGQDFESARCGEWRLQ